MKETPGRPEEPRQPAGQWSDVADAGTDLTWGVGAVSSRLGVAASTLRTWERRYGIGPSHRTHGGHRRYTERDITRVELVRRMVSRGVSAQDAARVARHLDRDDLASALRGETGHTAPVETDDVITLDVEMPRMDGMDLLQRLRQKTSMPVIFLTSKDDEIDEVLGLRMGADDYVKKPFSQRLLVERIRALLRRQDAIGGEVVPETEETKVMERGNLRMDPLRHAVAWKGLDVSLTVTEFLLLQALAQRPGFVKSRDQLMDVAYDDQVYVDDRTIDSHIKRLRKKMRSVDPEFSAIETLYGIGYRYNEE